MGKKLFALTCYGNPVDGVNKVAVSHRLQKVFAVDESTVEPFLKGEVYFRKENLNAFAANEYKRILDGIGLQAELSPQQDMVNEQSTPGLVSKAPIPEVVNMAEGMTMRRPSGKRHEQQVSANPESATRSKASKEKVENRNSKYSSILIRWGVILIVGSFFADEYLRDVSTLQQQGMSLGVWTYVFGFVLLGAGTYFLAMVRAETRHLRWLGLLSVLGLAVILLMSSSASGGAGFWERNKVRLIAATAILVIIYWTVDSYQASQELKMIMAQSISLQQGRSTYPSRQLDDMEYQLDKELDELLAFLDRGFQFLADNNLSLDDETRLGNQLFHQASLFLIWIRYQLVLRTLENMPANIRLSRVKNQVTSKLREGMAKLKSERVWHIKTQWMADGLDLVLVQQRDEKMQHIGNILNSYQMIIDRYLRDTRQQFSNGNLIQAMNKKQLRPISQVEIELDKNFIILTVAPEVVGGQSAMTLIMACYIERDDILGDSYVRIEQVGGDLPNRYLHHDQIVFR